MTLDEAQRRAYWLGQLADADRDAVEDAYFSSAEAFTLLRATEHDLLDDFARNALNEQDRQAFENHYLVTAERRRQLAFARTLTHRRARPALPAWAFAAAALAAAVVIMLLLAPRAAPPPRKHQATMAPPTPTPVITPEKAPVPKPLPALPLLALVRDTDRGAGEGNLLTLPRNAAAFRLTAPSAFAGPHRVEFITPEGVSRWTGAGTATRRADGFLVSCEVPAARLPDGAYIVRLTSAAGVATEFAAEIIRAPLR